MNERWTHVLRQQQVKVVNKTGWHEKIELGIIGKDGG